jgi:hypothetical protein
MIGFWSERLGSLGLRAMSEDTDKSVTAFHSTYVRETGGVTIEFEPESLLRRFGDDTEMNHDNYLAKLSQIVNLMDRNIRRKDGQEVDPLADDRFKVVKGSARHE